MSLYALPLLFADVKSFLAVASPGTNVVFGRRQPAQQVNQGTGRAARVVFQPGGPDGRAGAFEGAKIHRQGLGTRKPRSLATFRELVTVYVWGCDSSSPNDETKQYEAVHAILDQTIRAIYKSPNVGHGSYKMSGPQWLDATRTERRFGSEIFFLLEIESAILDEGPDKSGTIVNPTTAVGPAIFEVDKPPDPPVEITDGTDTTPPPE